MYVPVGHWSLYRCTISIGGPATPGSETRSCAAESFASDKVASRIAGEYMVVDLNLAMIREGKTPKKDQIRSVSFMHEPGNYPSRIITS